MQHTNSTRRPWVLVLVTLMASLLFAVPAATLGASSGTSSANGATAVYDPGTEHASIRETLSVIGADSRTRLAASAASRNPARGIAHLSIKTRKGVAGCTGFLVARNRIATAAHCLVDGGVVAPRNVSAQPGRNGAATPYRRCGAARTWVHPNYLRYRAAAYDYGIVVLKCSYSSSQVLSLEASTYARDRLGATKTQIIGYPGDKPYRTAWKSVGRLTEPRSTPLRLLYTNDSSAGMSGAPVYEYDAQRPCGAAYCVVGIHTNGGRTHNSGVRLTPTVIRNLLSR